LKQIARQARVAGEAYVRLALRAGDISLKEWNLNSPKQERNRILFRLAFISSILMLVIIPIQIAVFALFPIPASIEKWFDLMNNNFIVGLFHSDLFILVNNILISIIYLALFYSLVNDKNRSLLVLALTLGYIGIAAYISSNKTFELVGLAGKYLNAINENDKLMLLAAGQVMISSWQGTAFDVYYVLNGITLLILSITMLKSEVYSKSTAIFGLIAAVLMTVPSTAGIIGMVFSLLSLIPWYIFTIKYAKVFLKYSN